jgi:hypothetical protein
MVFLASFSGLNAGINEWNHSLRGFSYISNGRQSIRERPELFTDILGLDPMFEYDIEDENKATH